MTYSIVNSGDTGGGPAGVAPFIDTRGTVELLDSTTKAGGESITLYKVTGAFALDQVKAIAE